MTVIPRFFSSGSRKSSNGKEQKKKLINFGHLTKKSARLLYQADFIRIGQSFVVYRRIPVSGIELA
jgi:hypothetical protein